MSRVKKSVFALGVLSAVAAVPAVNAADTTLSWNLGVVNDYRFRGVSQSNKDPAVQGGIDFAHKSGFYLGTWASSIDFGTTDPKADVEVDVYGGYKWTAGLDWDVGVIHYAYPGSDSALDWPFTEVYLGAGYGPFSVKYYHTGDYTGVTSESAYYAVASANFELGGGFTLGLSAGKSAGDAFKVGGVDTSYTDYKIGISKEFAGIGFNLAYVDTSGVPEVTADEFNNEGIVVLTISKTF
jgi:uncharacterized protein (TIGR02001 family)